MKPNGAPPTPSRVRMVRPVFYRSELTGSLAPDLRDLLIGLTTMADDEGWMVWAPSEIAATLYSYQSARRRLRDLERRTIRLVEAGLLTIEPCGCASLPTLKTMHAIKGGEKNTATWGWHFGGHPGGLRSATDQSVSVSGDGSSSSSFSVDGSGSSSSGARDDTPPRDEAGGASAVGIDCGRPTSVHLPTCPALLNPALLRVVGG
jgi:hypothetical protein